MADGLLSIFIIKMIFYRQHMKQMMKRVRTADLYRNIKRKSCLYNIFFFVLKGHPVVFIGTIAGAVICPCMRRVDDDLVFWIGYPFATD